MRLPPTHPLATAMLAVALGATLGACGGDDASSPKPIAVAPAPTPSPAPTPTPSGTQDPGGLYPDGTLTSDAQGTSHPVVGVVSETGALQMVRADNNYQYSGQFTVNGAQATATLRVYDGTGKFLTTGSFTGTVITHSRISGSYTTASGDHGTLVLPYDNYYERPLANLASLVGEYRGTNGRSGSTEVLDVKSDGTFSGTTNEGCPFTGFFSQPDARYNLLATTVNVQPYAVSGTICDDLGAQPFNGFTVYTPAGGEQATDALDTLISSDRFATYNGFDKQPAHQQDGDGIYSTGTLTDAQGHVDKVLAMVDENDEFQIIDLANKNQYAGTFRSGNSGLRVYRGNGAGTNGTFSARIEPASRITGTITVAGGSAQQLSLTYDKALYETPATLAMAAGSYATTDPRSGGQSTLSVKNDGTLALTLGNGCTLAGSATVDDLDQGSRHDLFRIHLYSDFSSACQSLIFGGSGTRIVADGLAYYVPASGGALASLNLAFADGYGGFWGLYQRN